MHRMVRGGTWARPWSPRRVCPSNHRLHRILIATTELEFRLTSQKINHLYFSNRDKIAISRNPFCSAFSGTATPGCLPFSKPREADDQRRGTLLKHFARRPFAYDFFNRHYQLVDFAATPRKHTAARFLLATRSGLLLSPRAAVFAKQRSSDIQIRQAWRARQRTTRHKGGNPQGLGVDMA
jgi:hypothetical protein